MIKIEKINEAEFIFSNAVKTVAKAEIDQFNKGHQIVWNGAVSLQESIRVVQLVERLAEEAEDRRFDSLVEQEG